MSIIVYLCYVYIKKGEKMYNLIYALVLTLSLLIGITGCDTPTETDTRTVIDTVYSDSTFKSTIGDTLWIFTKDRLFLRAKECGDNVYFFSEKYSDSLVTANDSLMLIGIPYEFPLMEIRIWYQNQSEGGQFIIGNIGSDKALWWDNTISGFYDEVKFLDKDSILVLVNGL